MLPHSVAVCGHSAQFQIILHLKCVGYLSDYKGQFGIFWDVLMCLFWPQHSVCSFYRQHTDTDAAAKAHPYRPKGSRLSL